MMYLVSSSGGGGKLGHNLGSAGGSCSDISSIGGADNLAGGRATSSVVSGPSYNPGKGVISADDQNNRKKSSLPYFLDLFPAFLEIPVIRFPLFWSVSVLFSITF